jgi:4-diphosphocytidyl-2-C-methyl-D-erythritol kinase
MNNKKLTLRAPAKVNIRLKVTERRPDGYHELVSIMVPIGLFDDLDFETSQDSDEIEIDCHGRSLSRGKDNLVYRAAESFFRKTGIRTGVSIRLDKKIPIAAGLGGGSSDAATTLLALNHLHSDPLNSRELHELSLKLGADVPFFLESRPCLARGIGEILEPLEGWPEIWYIVITPPIHVSTAWVYGNLKLKLTSNDYDYILTALKTDTFAVSHILANDLERVTSARFPIINTLKNRLMDAGAEGSLMSGSGPSVFGLFSTKEKAESARQTLTAEDLGEIFVAKGLT